VNSAADVMRVLPDSNVGLSSLAVCAFLEASQL
jgi:hypothetical protein